MFAAMLYHLLEQLVAGLFRDASFEDCGIGVPDDLARSRNFYLDPKQVHQC